jgi:hypothetical protein
MYKEMLLAMVNGVSEDIAKEILTKLSSNDNTDANNFDPKTPLSVTTEEKSDDAYDVNGKLFGSDHEARSFLKANGYTEDSLGKSWMKGSHVAHIVFKTNDVRFKKLTGSGALRGYEIVVQ